MDEITTGGPIADYKAYASKVGHDAVQVRAQGPEQEEDGEGRGRQGGEGEGEVAKRCSWSRSSRPGPTCELRRRQTAVWWHGGGAFCV